MRKRDKIKRLSRRQIERMMKKGKETWMNINEVLKHGKWRGMKDDDEDQ